MAKLTAVTGNSGKTILSFYLSSTLSKKHRTLLLSTDGRCPTGKALFPTHPTESTKSLGRLLSLPVITDADVFNHAVVLSDNLLMLSYADGESYLNYPDISEISLHNLFAQLDRLVDCVIVDTSTVHSAIDEFAIAKAAMQMCITTADSKGFAYRQFCKPEHAVPVVLNDSPYNPLNDILKTFSEPVRYVLPYCSGLRGVYNGMNISDIVPSRTYRKTLYKIAGDILERL